MKNNHDEELVKKYLEKNYENIIFEPDGNITPDFSINKKTAVEVRRLSQIHNQKNLEETSIPFLNYLEKELSQFPAESENFWLSLEFERPIPKSKIIKKNLLLAIASFNKQNKNIPSSYQLAPNITLEFMATTHIKTSLKYNLGITADDEGGGFVTEIYTKALSHCIKEKTEKIAPHKTKYDSWWLILVDHIYSLETSDHNEKKIIINSVAKSHCFEKILVINPLTDQVVLEF